MSVELATCLGDDALDEPARDEKAAPEPARGQLTASDQVIHCASPDSEALGGRTHGDEPIGLFTGGSTLI
jgi:hypothetical protein